MLLLLLVKIGGGTLVLRGVEYGIQRIHQALWHAAFPAERATIATHWPPAGILRAGHGGAPASTISSAMLRTFCIHR